MLRSQHTTSFTQAFWSDSSYLGASFWGDQKLTSITLVPCVLQQQIPGSKQQFQASSMFVEEREAVNHTSSSLLREVTERVSTVHWPCLQGNPGKGWGYKESQDSGNAEQANHSIPLRCETQARRHRHLKQTHPQDKRYCLHSRQRLHCRPMMSWPISIQYFPTDWQNYRNASKRVCDVENAVLEIPAPSNLMCFAFSNLLFENLGCANRFLRILCFHEPKEYLQWVSLSDCLPLVQWN